MQAHFSGRDKLLHAADALFRTAPYGVVGVAAILDLAGVRAPSLYHHFEDKEELYVQWVETALHDVAYNFDRNVAEDFRSELERFARHLTERVNFDVPQALKDMLTLERESSQERVYASYALAIYEPLCGIFLYGIDRTEARIEPINRLADAFLAGCWALKPARGSEPEIARWWVRLFLSGIGTYPR